MILKTIALVGIWYAAIEVSWLTFMNPCRIPGKSFRRKLRKRLAPRVTIVTGKVDSGSFSGTRTHQPFGACHESSCAGRTSK